MNHLALLKNIKMVIFDFDGVFTNNQVIVNQDGTESVICNRSDGLGLDMLRKLGIEMAIVSTEKNNVVLTRAKKLRLDCYHGVRVKEDLVKKIGKEKGISLNQIGYVGNDINDLECLKMVGMPIAVADAYGSVKKVAKIILTKNGGDGAVREICELIRKQKNAK